MTKRAVVEETLLDIYRQEGILLPERVVALAKDRRHPLHGEFNWDDKSAAHQHRLDQARALIRTVEVEVLTADENYRVRVFQPRRYVGKDGGGYMTTDDITEQERPLLLRRMRMDWLAFRSRYQHLAEFWALVRGDGEEEVG